MFEGFNDRTVANMEVALMRACEKLHPSDDNHENRKMVATAIIECASKGITTLTELTEAGRKALEAAHQSR